MQAMVQGLSHNIRSVRDTGDELGARTTRVSTDIRNAMNAIQQVSQKALGIKDQVTGQDRIVSQAGTSVTDILQNLTVLDESIDSQSANLTETSASIEQMISNIHAVLGSIDLMDKAFGTLDGAANQGQAKLQAMVNTVGEVTTQSQRLQEANTIIKSISAKTNLLAMNAAIEAAHAGQSGRGFAVVADEIRTLAELSASQSKEISLDIKAIQAKIASLSQATEASRTAFALIMEQIAVLGRFEAEIRNAMHEQSTGSQQVLEATSEINNITSQVRTRSKAMVAGGTAIQQLMRDLVSGSAQAKHDITEIAGDTGRLEQFLAAMTQATNANAEAAALLVREVAHFVLEDVEETPATSTP